MSRKELDTTEKVVYAGWAILTVAFTIMTIVSAVRGEWFVVLASGACAGTTWAAWIGLYLFEWRDDV